MMIKVFLKKVLYFLLLAVMVSCIKDGTSDYIADIVKTGDSLPHFEIVMENGIKLSTEDMKGKVSVIVFFNTLCPDCRKELPVVQKIYENYAGNDDVRIIAISREEDGESVAGYWKDNDMIIPYSAQNDRKVYELFSTSGVPRIYISDRNMKVNYVHTDVDMPSYSKLVDEIESLI